MDRSAYPFPLAVNSSHHSHYHRFLLGADPSVIDPLPKPYCTGALAAGLGRLTGNLNLQSWRKLYHASFPWAPGFGPAHYDLGNVPAHRPLPPEYARPQRRFGAYDFVQVADPSLSALALVAGDRRVLLRFVALCDDFSLRLEEGAGTRDRGPAGSRTTGRMLAGQFAEPNNRWLMPFLHVHCRVLNFTSFSEAPGTLACIDPSALARAGQRALRSWVPLQAEALSDLGYRVGVSADDVPLLRVEGVSPGLVAVLQAPRIAVLRLLERMIAGEREPSAGRLASELPAPVIAAMADQIESVLARSHPGFKPGKIAIPSEGPWRACVRRHLAGACPGPLAALDAAASRAGARPCGASLFPSSPIDPAHCHAPSAESLEAQPQLPCDPELGARAEFPPAGRLVSPWLAREFEVALGEVNEGMARTGTGGPLAPLRRLLATIDQLSEAASPGQLRQAQILLDVELERRDRDARDRGDHAEPSPVARRDLVPPEELFEGLAAHAGVQEREIGGRSL